MKIAVFASHGGSDLQAIIDGCKNRRIGAEVAAVISNNEDSTALQRAHRENIPAYHLSAKKYGSEEKLAQEILSVLATHKIDMIFLAGYMRMLHASVLEAYRGRIFNIHPALLPKFGGKGMYGMNVHRAVLDFPLVVHDVGHLHKGKLGQLQDDTVLVYPGAPAPLSHTFGNLGLDIRFC